ncbi:MAG: hypothetical protein IT374_15695 [Polyangiaceae bacterium]|nr:hypothetical protein [Polyangiaceae bacterium]
MARDSVYGERIIHAERPGEIVPTALERGATWLLGTAAMITALLAVAAAVTIDAEVQGLVAFAAWCASLGVAVRLVPQLWHQGAELLVTARHVVWSRGGFRRSIDRAQISFARIHWYPGGSGRGDLELVRDVPTGALRRKLSITFRGVAHPDRLWELIRSGDVSHLDDRAPARPVGARLPVGERVVWTEKTRASWRDFVPERRRDLAACLLGVSVAVAVVWVAPRAVAAARGALDAGVAPTSLGFLALAGSLALTVALLFGTAAALVWSSIVAPGLRAGRTRYVITDQRVLIASWRDELLIDRSRIVDVIASARVDGHHDLFLVIDGPSSRGVTVSGAFEEGPPGELMPVLRGIVDVDDARRLLVG